MGHFKVDGMSCSHCEKAIKSELVKGNPAVKVYVNVSEKSLKVENLPDDRVIFLLKELGYTPHKVK